MALPAFTKVIPLQQRFQFHEAPRFCTREAQNRTHRAMRISTAAIFQLALVTLVYPGIPAVQAQADAIPALPESMHFRILDGEKAIGQLSVHFSRIDDVLVVSRTEDLSVRRLMIAVKVEQRVEERWRGTRFESLNSETSAVSSLGNVRKNLSVTRQIDGTLEVKFDHDISQLPDGTLPMSLWGAPVIHEGQFFDLGGGQKVQISIQPSDRNTEVLSYRNSVCKLNDIQAVGQQKTRILLWVNSDGSPCGMRVHTEIGDLVYERTE